MKFHSYLKEKSISYNDWLFIKFFEENAAIYVLDRRRLSDENAGRTLTGGGLFILLHKNLLNVFIQKVFKYYTLKMNVSSFNFIW